MSINIIFASTPNNIFASSDRLSLPWGYNKDDMDFFKEKTIGSTVIMGLNTFKSLCHQPLKNRINIVVSSSLKNNSLTLANPPEKYYITSTLDEAIHIGKQLKNEIFIIGGMQLINESLQKDYIDNIYHTIIDYPNRFFEGLKHEFKISFPLKNSKIVSKPDYTLYFNHYENCRKTEEQNYIDLVKKVLQNGEDRDDRTSIGTMSTFGEQIKLNISEYFPLLTSKRVFWKGVLEELLFFISGETDTKVLEEKGINIWKGNTSMEFLDKRGLKHFKEGEYGEVYGYNWRHFNKPYTPILQRDVTYIKDGGIDQLQDVIDSIKNDPYSRRHFLTAWNPSTINNVPLPPCHTHVQFYVGNKDKNKETLSCQVYMRSADLFLGVPFNIASYATLTYMICHLTNLKPYELSICIGDAHIYKNHIEQCKEMLNRPLRTLPKLKIKGNKKTIDDFVFEDFVIENYNPHPTIKADMAV